MQFRPQFGELVRIGMEDFGSFSAEPVDECKRKVSQANYLILVLADRYGYVPPGYSQSMTHIEYNTAREHKITILPYFKEQTSPRWTNNAKTTNQDTDFGNLE